jgi:hypothetical protein
MRSTMADRVDQGTRHLEVTGAGLSWPTAFFTLLIGLAAALYASAFSFAVLNRTSNPVVALAIPPTLPPSAARMGDLRILLAQQDRLKQMRLSADTPEAVRATAQAMMANAAVARGLGGDLAPADHRAIQALAYRGLRATPLAGAALRQLAFIEDDPDKRIELLRLAQSVTKRDTLAALQFAEFQFGSRPQEALRSINRALVVSRNLDQTIFPMLLLATDDPLATAQIGQMLRRDPEWTEPLVLWGIANPPMLPALSRLLNYIPAESVARQAGYGQPMVDMLVQQKRYPEAFAAYRAYSPHPQQLSNLLVSDFPPLDWKLIDNYETGSRPFGKDEVELFANPGRQGDVAQIISRLAPGSYAMSLVLADTIGQGELRFVVACLSATGERGVADDRVTLRNGRVALSFAIPAAGCRYQQLSLRIGAEEVSAGALVKSISLIGAPQAQNPR